MEQTDATVNPLKTGNEYVNKTIHTFRQKEGKQECLGDVWKEENEKENSKRRKALSNCPSTFSWRGE